MSAYFNLTNYYLLDMFLITTWKKSASDFAGDFTVTHWHGYSMIKAWLRHGYSLSNMVQAWLREYLCSCWVCKIGA